MRFLFVGGAVLLTVALVSPRQVAAQAPPTPPDPNQKVLSDIQKQLESINERLDKAAQENVSREEFDNWKEALLERIQTLSAKVEAISRVDQDGSTIPSLRNAMERNANFRAEMTDVVRSVIPGQGTLRVLNYSGANVTMRINGGMQVVPAFTSIEVRVPVGAVTTELVGLEAAKTWNIAPPNYSSSIDIRPAF